MVRRIRQSIPVSPNFEKGLSELLATSKIRKGIVIVQMEICIYWYSIIPTAASCRKWTLYEIGLLPHGLCIWEYFLHNYGIMWANMQDLEAHMTILPYEFHISCIWSCCWEGAVPQIAQRLHSLAIPLNLLCIFSPSSSLPLGRLKRPKAPFLSRLGLLRQFTINIHHHPVQQP